MMKHISLMSMAWLFATPAIAQTSDLRSAPKSTTRAEAEARVRDRLGAMDANKDGTVSADEARIFAEAQRKRAKDAHFAAMDADKNGSISRAEFDAAHEGAAKMSFAPQMMRLEKAEGEIPGMRDRKPPMRRQMRIMMIGDGAPMAWRGDGKGIVIDDAVKRALERFDAADTNKDGTLSPDERKAARQTMRERWKARRG